MNGPDRPRSNRDDGLSGASGEVMRRRNKPVGKAAKHEVAGGEAPHDGEDCSSAQASGVRYSKGIALLEHRPNEALEQQARARKSESDHKPTR